MNNLIVKDIINSSIAVATDSGDKVFNEIVRFLNNDEVVNLDFKDITILTTAFLNAAIGQLYSNERFSSEFLNKNLTVINVLDEDKALFSIVITRAKEYFKNKKSFGNSVNDTLNGE